MFGVHMWSTEQTHKFTAVSFYLVTIKIYHNFTNNYIKIKEAKFNKLSSSNRIN